MRATPAALGLAVLAAASSASAQSSCVDGACVRIEVRGCASLWFDRVAFASALAVELTAEGMRIDDEDDDAALALEVSCERETDAIVVLSVAEGRNRISLIDVAPRLRMRMLALSAHDLVREARAATSTVSAVAPPPETTPPPPDRSERAGSDAARRLGDATVASEGADDVDGERTPERSRWLTVGLSFRGILLGARVVAPGLALEVEARLIGTPLSIWVAADALYATATDVLGDVQAIGVGARVGARVAADLTPVSLSLALGVPIGWARAEGVARDPAASASSIDGVVVGVELFGALALSVSSEVRLALSIGAIAFLAGFDARSEDRSIISFRDIAPTLSVGLGVDIAP